MIKETGIEKLYNEFRHYGRLEYVKTLDFLPIKKCVTLKVFNLNDIIRLFILENGDVKKTEIIGKK